MQEKPQVLNLLFGVFPSNHQNPAFSLQWSHPSTSAALKAPVLTALLLYMLDMHWFLFYVLQLLTNQPVTPLRLPRMQHNKVLPIHSEAKQKKYSIVDNNYKNIF